MMYVCDREDQPKKGKPINVFEAVKKSVTAREAAKHYGIKVNHNGLARCPFHDDRTPSMKLDKRYHCFGCQADGDVIDLTARLFEIPAKDAAMKLSRDFNIYYGDGESGSPVTAPAAMEPVTPEAKLPPLKPDYEGKSDDGRFLDDMWRYATVLLDYQSLLKRWHVEYAPADAEEEWHPLFREALQEEAHVEYILDVLMNGSRTEVADLITDEKDKVDELEKRISQYSGGGVIQSEM